MQDAVYRSVRQTVPPTMYFPVAQNQEPPSFISLSVRAAGGSPAFLIRPLTAALAGVNDDLPITFRPLAEQVNASLIQERVVALLSGLFDGLALLLAGPGLVLRQQRAVNLQLPTTNVQSYVPISKFQVDFWRLVVGT